MPGTHVLQDVFRGRILKTVSVRVNVHCAKRVSVLGNIVSSMRWRLKPPAALTRVFAFEKMEVNSSNQMKLVISVKGRCIPGNISVADNHIGLLKEARKDPYILQHLE